LILSNLLSSDLDPNDKGVCDMILTIHGQLQQLFALQLGGLLAGEPADYFNGSSVAGEIVRADVNESGNDMM